MPRRRRLRTGGLLFHVLNRAAAGRLMFTGPSDYDAFERLLREAKARVPMRLLAFCLMPTHWHMVLWPEADGLLSAFMHWLCGTHVQRWHAFGGTAGTGGLYQGRFKAVPIQSDHHFLTVCRYVERNPLRAALVDRAEDWKWSSYSKRLGGEGGLFLEPWPLRVPAGWADLVNSPEPRRELEDLRACVRRSCPFGDPDWQHATAAALGLEATLRPRGRPCKQGTRPAHEACESTPDPFPLPGL